MKHLGTALVILSFCTHLLAKEDELFTMICHQANQAGQKHNPGFGLVVVIEQKKSTGTEASLIYDEKSELYTELAPSVEVPARVRIFKNPWTYNIDGKSAIEQANFLLGDVPASIDGDDGMIRFARGKLFVGWGWSEDRTKVKGLAYRNPSDLKEQVYHDKVDDDRRFLDCTPVRKEKSGGGGDQYNIVLDVAPSTNSTNRTTIPGQKTGM